ncbi:hypothetical protein OG203_03095 [Nocardia sp. NBC_01499]|uniref:DUF6636 domain-containing protein n=1 Tax=Nocardia sp. NBC_01499 TaxID=2903597 RepID=UPI00386FAEFF
MTGPSGDGYYFASPSGSFGCAIIKGTPAGDMVAGCQGAHAAVAPGGKDCGTNPGALQVADTVGPDGAAQNCANQPFFVAPGAKALAYGASISAKGYTCQSDESGMSCRSDSSGHGFKIAREANSVF